MMLQILAMVAVTLASGNEERTLAECKTPAGVICRVTLTEDGKEVGMIMDPARPPATYTEHVNSDPLGGYVIVTEQPGRCSVGESVSGPMCDYEPRLAEESQQ